jgi:hypothetical protein
MSVVGELGGMRYMTNQQLVNGLIKNVFYDKLESIDFPMGNPNNLLFYLRRQRFMASRFDDAKLTGDSFKTRYDVGPKWEGKSADEIFTAIVAKVLAHDNHSLSEIQNSKDPPKYWDEVKKSLVYRFPDSPYHGLHVYELGFWNVIKDQTNQECYSFLSQAGGYYSNTINWNAAEAFPYMAGDFADSAVEYKTISGGYDQILTSLASTFLEDGGVIWTKNKLTKFSRNPSFSPLGDPYRYILHFYNIESAIRWKVYAKDIILAMPRRSLQLLDQDNFFFSSEQQPHVQKTLSSVIMEPSFKVLLGFETPWWKTTLKALAGESITDLPMRQCYYFGVDPQNNHSLFLATYNDMRSVPFWTALKAVGEKYNPIRSQLYQPASAPMVRELMNQVRELHGPGVGKIPEPYTSAFKDWSADPYGGGYHAWMSGVKVWEVMPSVRQLLINETVYIVGEAYSVQQGWVEGAFCTAEHILQEKYGLSPPSWAQNYYLGW